MGIFSTKKTVQVASSAYNLAGDINDRPDFLKTTIVSITTGNGDYGAGIPSAYINGPGVKLRRYADWCRDSNYITYLDMTRNRLALSQDVDKVIVAGEIPVGVGETAVVQSAELGGPDFTAWADEWLTVNYPDQLGTNYEVDYDAGTNQITITLVDTSVHTFTATGFDPKGDYLYAAYVVTSGYSAGSITTGTTYTITPSTDPFPSVTGWTTNSYVSTSESIDLDVRTEVTVDWSDATPDTYSDTTVTTPHAYTEIHAEYERTTYTGWHAPSNSRRSLREIRYHDQVGSKTTSVTTNVVVDDMGGGVTRTTTTVVHTDTFVLTKTYRTDEQILTLETYGPVQRFIYPYGTGNSTLDALFVSTYDTGDFLTFIPIRLNNSFVEVTGAWDWLYVYANRAMRRAIGVKLNKIKDLVADNPKLSDIDYAYVTFGVSLNSPEPTAKEYMYEFFKEIMTGQDLSGSELDGWNSDWAAAKAAEGTWITWRDAQSVPGDPLYGTAAPPYPSFPTIPGKVVRVASNHVSVNYDMTVSWNGIKEVIGTGLGKPGAVEGEYWIDQGASTSYEEFVTGGDWGDYSQTYDVEITRFWYQETNTTWRRFDVSGLKHRNMIYGGKFVDITASEALADAEESGFIIPLHEEIYKRMSLVHGTQLTTGCAYIIFNSYSIVKEKWYQTTWFKVIIIVVVVAITIASGGLGAETIGLLGTNFAVGSALGFTGTAAVIAGAVVNAIAAILLTRLITMVSTSIFGDKIGAIVAAVVSVIALTVGTSLMNGGDISTALGELTKAENLLKITAAAGKGVSEAMNADAQDVIRQTQAYVADYAAQTKELAKKNRELYATFGGEIDPTVFLDQLQAPVESADTFFARTLLTGSDIADLANGMPGNFTSIALTTEPRL